MAESKQEVTGSQQLVQQEQLCGSDEATIAIGKKQVVTGYHNDGRPQVRTHHLHLQHVDRIREPSADVRVQVIMLAASSQVNIATQICCISFQPHRNSMVQLCRAGPWPLVLRRTVRYTGSRSSTRAATGQS